MNNKENTLKADIIDQFLVNRKLLNEALLKRSESLSSLLPYEEFISDKNIFVNKDGSFGVIFEANLFEHEAMNSRSVIESVKSFKSFFTLPENCVLQVLFDQAHISINDKQWDHALNYYKRPHPVSKLLFEEKINKLKEVCNSTSEFAPLKRKTLISIKYFPNKEAVTLFKGRSDKGEKFLYDELSEFVKELNAFSNIVSQFKENSTISLKFLDANDLLSHLRRFFNPKEFYNRNFAKFNKHHSLSDQIIYHSPTLDYQGIEREGIKTRTITLKTSPQFAYAGGMAYFTKLTFPYKISLNFSFPSKLAVKKFFDLKEFFLENNISRKAERQREEIKAAQARIASGERCLYLTFSIVIEGETDEILNERSRKVIDIFHNQLECEVITENEIGLGLALNSLPLNYSPEADYSTQRYIRILQKDAVMFLPLFDSFRGLEKPLQYYLSRENNIVPFSLTENETSNHTVVLADSGSGKSCFIIDCIQAAKRQNPEPLVFVIDKKSSYKGMVGPFNGELTKFDPNEQMPFSPFRGEFDDAKVSFLTQLLVTAINLTSPKFDLESEHLSIISKSLVNAYVKKSNEKGLNYTDGVMAKDEDQKDKPTEVTIDDFVGSMSSLASDPEFTKMSKQIEEILKKLKPFYGDGVYSKYFKQARNAQFDPDCLLYVYDLDALRDEKLQTLMTMSVIEEIRRMIQRPEHKSRGGFIVIEELGMLGRDNPEAEKFIIDAAETFRKLGFWLIGLTPRPQNYFELDAGKAMWSVADNFVILKMSPDNIDYLSKNSTLLDEATTQIANSLHLEKGKYAEVFYTNKNKSKQGSFRYHLGKYDRWLAATNQADLAKLEDTLSKHKGNSLAALEELANSNEGAK